MWMITINAAGPRLATMHLVKGLEFAALLIQEAIVDSKSNFSVALAIVVSIAHRILIAELRWISEFLKMKRLLRIEALITKRI